MVQRILSLSACLVSNGSLVSFADKFHREAMPLIHANKVAYSAATTGRITTCLSCAQEFERLSVLAHHFQVVHFQSATCSQHSNCHGGADVINPFQPASFTSSLLSHFIKYNAEHLYENRRNSFWDIFMFKNIFGFTSGNFRKFFQEVNKTQIKACLNHVQPLKDVTAVFSKILYKHPRGAV